MTDKNHNLYAHFAAAFASNKSKALLTTVNEEELSFEDVDRRSAQIANYLTTTGAKRGERVSVQVQKSPENLCLYFACLRAGFVYHPLNQGYKTKELEYFIGNAEASLIVCDTRNENEFQTIAKAAGVNHVLTLNGDGSGSLFAGANGESGAFDTVQSDASELAALLYSSGTTGIPKGIMLSHQNLLANAQTLVQVWGFTENDRLLHALPIFHVHGLFVALGCVMLSGASMRWLPGFDSRTAIRYLPECTVMMGVPTYYTRLLSDESFTADVCSNMRLFVSGSAPLLEETFTEFEARTGHQILERYGMTETNMNTSNPLNGKRKPGTVGPALPGVEIRITDDEGNALPQGDIGNLQVRGNNVFSGYWRMPDRTAADFTDDGFFNTGDMGRIDSDNYLAIVGRSKDLVITGGLNVYPKEIELFIDELPGVLESAVIGIPHADFGEAVVAVVVASSLDATNAEAIITSCRQELANFKVPKGVVFVNELPRNTMAKVQKNALRDAYKDLLD